MKSTEFTMENEKLDENAATTDTTSNDTDMSDENATEDLEEPQTLTMFTRFPKLPPELRLKIVSNHSLIFLHFTFKSLFMFFASRPLDMFHIVPKALSLDFK